MKSASTLSSSRLLFVEGRAALAAAGRGRRIRRRSVERVRRRFEDVVGYVDLLDLDATVVSLAGDAAEAYRLRAGDAIHLASALLLWDRDLVVASWDADLRRAAQEAGLAVFPARLTASSST